MSGQEARGRLSRSGRMMPLVKPPTIAPPIDGAGEMGDEYDELSIEVRPAEPRPARGSTAPPDEKPKRRWAWLPWAR